MRDREYLLAVKQLPCCMAGRFDIVFVFGAGGTAVRFPCSGPIEADHAGRRPYGRKCSDDETIPLCRSHHAQRTNGLGWFFFVGLARDKDKLRDWLDARIDETQRALLGKRSAA